MNIKNNRRVIMTKKIIKDTFIEMLEKEDISKIHIRDLCNKADINRSTFYKYYDSQYSVLAEMEQELLEQIKEKCDIKSDNSKNLCNMLSFLQSNKKVYKILFNSSTNHSFAKKIFDLPIILESLNEKIPCKDNFNYKQTYILQGGYHIVFDWLNNDCKESPEIISDILINCIKQNLK